MLAPPSPFIQLVLGWSRFSSLPRVRPTWIIPLLPDSDLQKAPTLSGLLIPSAFRWIASEIFRLCVLIKKEKKKGKEGEGENIGERDIEFFIRALDRKVRSKVFSFFFLSNFHPIFIYLSSVGAFLFGSCRCATWYTIGRFHCSFFVWIAIFYANFIELFPFRYNIGKGCVSKGCKRSETRNRDTSCKKEWDVSWLYREILLDSVSNVVRNVWLYVVIIIPRSSRLETFWMNALEEAIILSVLNYS